MIRTHDYRGLWWVPGNDAERLPGTLTVNHGEVVLELIGTFGHQLLSERAKEKTYSLDLAEHPRLVGLSTDGKPITLEGHRAAPHSMSFPGIPTSTYMRDVALIGKEFAEGEEIGFDEISIRASDLNSWTQVSGFTQRIGTAKHAEKGFDVLSSVEIRFDAPDDIAIPLARGENAFIRFDAPSKGIGLNVGHVSLTQQAAFHIRFGKRASLEQVFERVGVQPVLWNPASPRPLS